VGRDNPLLLLLTVLGIRLLKLLVLTLILIAVAALLMATVLRFFVEYYTNP